MSLPAQKSESVGRSAPVRTKGRRPYSKSPRVTGKDHYFQNIPTHLLNGLLDFDQNVIAKLPFPLKSKQTARFKGRHFQRFPTQRPNFITILKRLEFFKLLRMLYSETNL